MKKWFSLMLVLIMCLSMTACGTSGSGVQAPVQTSNIPEYLPGAVVKTDVAEITILEAAFCEKAQLIDALPKPAYNTAGEGRIVFAMRAQITNTTEKDLVLFDDLKINICYGGDQSFGCSKGGNYTSSDPLYKILPGGSSGEYILCGRVPVETYRANNGFYVDFNGEKLGFSYGEIQVYNTMGYQDGDNVSVSMETVIASAGVAPADEAESKTPVTESMEAFSFALEDARVDNSGSSLKIEAKIRNNSDYHFVSVVFDGVILDHNGDILENCGFIYSNGLEAGQAGWSYIPVRETSTVEHMAAVKLITVWYKDDPQAPSHNLRYDLPEPIVIDLTRLATK